MPSITEKGVSKICPTLVEGSGVVSTRANIHWVVTEYGAVNLYGKTLQERAKLLISIAHPKHQAMLDQAAFERFGPHYRFVPVSK
jgi:acyl-CoA hydrolase